jgi:hypothetical protein
MRAPGRTTSRPTRRSSSVAIRACLPGPAGATLTFTSTMGETNALPAGLAIRRWRRSPRRRPSCSSVATRPPPRRSTTNGPIRIVWTRRPRHCAARAAAVTAPGRRHRHVRRNGRQDDAHQRDVGVERRQLGNRSPTADSPSPRVGESMALGTSAWSSSVNTDNKLDDVWFGRGRTGRRGASPQPSPRSHDARLRPSPRQVRSPAAGMRDQTLAETWELFDGARRPRWPASRRWKRPIGLPHAGIAARHQTESMGQPRFAAEFEPCDASDAIVFRSGRGVPIFKRAEYAQFRVVSRAEKLPSVPRDDPPARRFRR